MKLINIRDLKIADYISFGSKAVNLSVLTEAGLPTPEGWVVPSKAFDSHLTQCNLLGKLSQISSILDDELLKDVRKGIELHDLDAQLIESLSGIPDVPLAVRSSASVEDQTTASYSGLFKTVIGVKGIEELTKAIKDVWASVFTLSALTYHKRMNPEKPYPAMAVLIMPMVAADRAGVAFSANPADGNPFIIAVSACHGLGPTVVDGTEQCDEYLLDLNTLEAKKISIGAQRKGLFLAKDGRVETRSIPDSKDESRVCGDEELKRLGELVQAVDNLFGGPIDIEFAIANGQISLLQARPLVGLAPFFPDNPEEDSNVHRSAEILLSPFTQARISESKDISSTVPPPPWPLEVSELVIQHGRLFFRRPENPELEEHPEAPWEDRTFLQRMLILDNPADDLLEARCWAELVYKKIIPSLRKRAKNILNYSRQELTALNKHNLYELLLKALKLDRECFTLYVSASGGTYEILRRIEILIRDWITGPDYKVSQPIAHATIQGSAKLTHKRDGELEQVANSRMSEDDYACCWGYGYLNIEDMMDVSQWKCWREDITPVRIAAELIRKGRNYVSFKERLRQSVKQSKAAFQNAPTRIGGANEKEIKRRRRIFTACVEAGRCVFSLKDDRDLVFAHGQSALRWVLMEIGRRLKMDGIGQDPDDVFLLYPSEIADWLQEKAGDASSVRQLIKNRRIEQRRLARYKLPPLCDKTTTSVQETDAVLKAAPASTGVAEGPARIVNSIEDVAALQPGEILCLMGERRVGWTMFFPIIAGLAYKKGNWLCHEANLCRELGIPAVVCIGSQLRQIHNGESLRIDGSKGTVTRLTGKVEASRPANADKLHD